MKGRERQFQPELYVHNSMGPVVFSIFIWALFFFLLVSTNAEYWRLDIIRVALSSPRAAQVGRGWGRRPHSKGIDRAYG